MKFKLTALFISSLFLASTAFADSESADSVGDKNKQETETNQAQDQNKIDPSIKLVDNAEAHLTFHMGLSAEGQNFIGGSIENHGSKDVYSGYLVVLPINEKCEPLKPLLQTFGNIPSGERIPFRVPIDGGLSGYRMIGFNAFDDMGYPINAVDDTLKIIQERIPAERETCLEKRKEAKQ